ncbi:ribosome biogenesis GTP-binding protein YihA/YsxC [Desulfotruncus alcoholivorax]|uniref:ribosome biogenesis GTP-binding protein YihA/YsxC n=1 Tax=Desulfotruncus alcoholivorax TaxID=265477 RepID=UPI00041ADC5F|nr:ribosome biogenesis GTP-binding protein YihA/YsxC [Desulfotruncus alcoholivorax]
MKITTADFETSAVKLEQCPAGDYPEVALAGRSNVGKSSLLNSLVNRKRLARTSNTPGRTQLINFFLINGSFYLVDLPGYGFAKVPARVKAEWGQMVEGYLSQRKQLRGVLQLVDVRHAPTADDLQMYNWLKYYGIPTAVVATKADKISRGRSVQNLAVIRKTISIREEDPLLLFSAVTGHGKDEVWKVIGEWVHIGS